MSKVAGTLLSVFKSTPARTNVKLFYPTIHQETSCLISNTDTFKNAFKFWHDPLYFQILLVPYT